MIRAMVFMVCLLASPVWATEKLPFDVGGAFELIDQTGAKRTQVAPDGHLQMLVFGYANCTQICTATLPLIAMISDDLKAQDLYVDPVMITVDPARDTVDTIGPALAKYHPDFIGLTGSEEALQVAYDAFEIEREVLFIDPVEGPVYAHGGYIYLLNDAGEVLTLIPPILPPEQVFEIALKYAKASQ